MRTYINDYFKSYTEAASLAVFRIFFGILMCISIIRFWSYGWIEKLYITPNFFFSYYGFDFIKPFGNYTYLIFLICGLSTIFIILGYKYRIAILTFFLSFTYIELMDKTTYLNHYYFISILSFLLLFLPAHCYFSIDAKKEGKAYQYIPRWTVDSVKLLLGIVYFYAGLAKLNSDWLVRAMPLKIWLPSNADLPVIGGLLQQEWVHYAFSYSGAIYDLAIPFLLWYRKTRPLAFVAVIVFHLLTRVLFPIGMFPYIMIVSALIFFDAKVHTRLIEIISKYFRISLAKFNTSRCLAYTSRSHKIYVGIVVVFFGIQLFLPFRYVCYPGELFWTEEGYRFSWRVMLMEKAGYANFKIVDKATGTYFYVDNDDFLTSFQQKQMATQPDFILQYAQYLKQHFETQGHQNVQVFVESHVALNGRLSTPYIDPTIDLGQEKDSFQHKTWIIPFQDEIKGL